MITRGHFVGYIIDEFSDIQNRVIFRNKFGLTDAATILENFYLEILNITFDDSNFKNTNIGSGNADTIDLISDKLMIIIQVTSSLDPEKIVKTCESYKQNSKLKNYSLKFLAIGNRQQKYGSLEVQNALIGTNISLDNDIWDNKSIISEIVNLNTDKLSQLYTLFKNNSLKVSVDLEIPDEKGEFTTSLNYQFKDHHTLNGITEFLRIIRKNYGEGEFTETEKAMYLKAFSGLADFLSQLPRSSREFLTASLTERLSPSSEGMQNRFKTFLPILERKLKWDRILLNEEINIIEKISIRAGLNNFFSLYIDEDNGDSFIRIGSDILGCECFLDEIFEFLKSKNITIDKVFTKIDFSDFT